MRVVEQLTVYRRSYQASLRIHQLSLGFSQFEQYKGLASQLRDSSKSIVANLVEGYGFKKLRVKRFLNHIEISLGSCDETRLWLKYCLDLGYLEESDYQELEQEYQEIGKMLWGLYKSVRASEE